jgi:transposase InsO family protein
MGLKISPAVFQRMMNLIFKDHLNKFLLIYLDDIVVYSKDATSHLEHLRTAFQRLKQAGLGIKAKKCQMFRTQIKFLGFLVSKEGVQLDPAKIEAVLNFPTPKEDLGQLQSFLGMVGYFKKHIKDYALIAKPLYDMFKGEDTHTKKRKGKVRTVYKKNIWGPAQDEAIRKLKEVTTTAPLLIYPDFNKPLILTTDASQHALGYVLSQATEEGERPVAYGSRLLKGAEKNYSNTDREMLAVITGMQHYRSYVYGRHFKVRTDHQAIALINKGKITLQRVCKWLLQTQDYDFEIEYTPATKIRHADALSRVQSELMSSEAPPGAERPNEVNLLEGKEEIDSNPEENSSFEDLCKENPQSRILEHSSDVRMDLPEYEPVIDIYEWGKQQQLDHEIKKKFEWVQEANPPDFAIHNDTLYQMIKPEDGFVPIAPTVFRKRILAQFHGPPFVGHQGPERTYRNMRKYVYWKGMRKDVEEFIDKCDACQRHKRSYLRVPMQHQMIPPAPFHTVSMDVQGPLVPTEYGEEYILVIQDMLTRWIELAPMKTADTKTILSRLENCWIKRYGYPQRLLTDRASVFVGQEMAEFCDFYGIEKIHTTAYRPQGNGANERTHQELTKYLSMYLEDERKDKWRWLLPNAMYVLNTSDHAALGMSPYEALFAIIPSLGAIGYPRKIPEDQEKFEEFYGMRREHVMEVRKRAAELLQKSQDRVVERHNRFSHEIPFKVGDYVMYKNHRQKTKFDPKYTGPWKIIAQISATVFELAMGKYRFSAHAVYLKPYHGTVLAEPEEDITDNLPEEEVTLPIFDEDGQPVELDDIRRNDSQEVASDPQDELYGPQQRAERFRNFGKNIKRKIYRTIPQIRSAEVASSTPRRYRIPTSGNEWEIEETIRRGSRMRRAPDRWTYT